MKCQSSWLMFYNNNSIYLFIYLNANSNVKQRITNIEKIQGDNKQASKINMAVTQKEKIKTIWKADYNQIK